MISRFENKSFFAAHYDWIAAGIGLAALVAGGLVFVLSLGADPDSAAAEEVARVDRLKPQETGVKPVDMTSYLLAYKAAKSPTTVVEIGEKDESFLSSERRVFCAKCKKAISGDIKAVPACPFCGEKQKEEKKVVVDADADGLPDEWERRYGLNPSDASDANADADGDGFTNHEEFLAKTNPTDKNDHPDYLDSLAIVLPLKETKMPFVFRKAYKLPAGWRCEFFDPHKVNNYNRKGVTLTAVVGEEIVSRDVDIKTKKRDESGFLLKSYTPKSEKRAIKGSESMTKSVDVSEVVVERRSDGKKITLVIQEGAPLKLAPVDVQAMLSYTRGTVKNFDVVPGSEIDLNGSKYRIVDIKAVGKGAKVTVEDSLSGKKRVLEALESDGK